MHRGLFHCYSSRNTCFPPPDSQNLLQLWQQTRSLHTQQNCNFILPIKYRVF